MNGKIEWDLKRFLKQSIYTESATYDQIINEIENKNIAKSFDFKDKIIIVGTTAMALHDTKSVPIQGDVYPGVEVHATFFNNLLDNNFIYKTNKL